MRLGLPALAALALTLPAAAQSISSAVNEAIDRGAVRLMQLQAGNGSWSQSGYHGSYPMGATAFTAYTLRKSGLPANHDALKRAQSFLAERRPQKVYDAASMLLFLDSLGGKAHTSRIHRLADWLEEATDPKTYLWAYPAGQVDLSNSQFAALGLWAAANHDYQVSAHTWMRIIDSLRQRQNRDGGFGYRGDYHPESSGGMTAAGITMLSLADRELARTGTHPAQVRARIGIEDAWKWFDTHFTATGNPAWGTGWIRDRGPEGVGSHMYHYYYLYGLERVAALSDREQIGGRDWYREGAIDLLKNQRADGGWGSIEDTCFALLFLRRATFSALNKKEYTLAAGHRPVEWHYRTQGPGAGWQERVDETWSKGKPPFGLAGPGRTTWTARDLYATREFDWEGPKELFRAFAEVDDHATFWLNGVELAKVPSYTAGRFAELDVSDAARAALKPRGNVLAAHVVNTGGPGSFQLRFDPLGIDVAWDARLVEKANRARRAFWKVRPLYGVPWMKRWLVLGPVADKDGVLLNDAERLPDSSTPEPGKRRLGSTWREVLATSGRVPLEGRGQQDGVWWAFTWLHAEDAAQGALWLGSERPLRVVLDGEVLRVHNLAGNDDDARHVVPLSLSKGSHALMVKLSGRGNGQRSFSARFADASGRPLPQVTASLDAAGPEPLWRAMVEGPHLDAATLAAELPRAGSRMNFDRATDLNSLAVAPSARDFPRWGRDARAAGGPGDPKGVVALRAPSRSTPCRASLKLKVTPGRSKINVRAASSKADGAHARLRLEALLPEGRRVLTERDLRPGDGWQTVTGELPEGVDREFTLQLVVIQPGDGDPRLFVDDIELR